MPKCIRVYLNGRQIEHTYEDREVQAWLEYNKRFRPGCALFVNNKCEYPGYLLNESCRKISDILLEED